MPDLSTTLAVLLAMTAGTTIIRFLIHATRRLRGENGDFSFSDFLVEDRVVEYRDFVWMALPPFVGGMALAFWPGTNGGIAGAAGFLAAFLSVWPVYRFPLRLLEEPLRPFWPRLKFLYSVFVCMSASLAYVGFVIVDRLLPVDGTLLRARIWQQLLDRLWNNAAYGPAKYALAALFVLGGIYFNRERVSIGKRAAALKQVALVGDPRTHRD